MKLLATINDRGCRVEIWENEDTKNRVALVFTHDGARRFEHGRRDMKAIRERVPQMVDITLLPYEDVESGPLAGSYLV